MPSFWDMQKRLAERRRARAAAAAVQPTSAQAPPQAAGASAPALRSQKPLTVTQFATRVNHALKQALPSEFTVRGEIADWSVAPSGHHYFCLKDARSSLQCVMWQSDAMYLKFQPQVGQEVTVTGFADSYGLKSQYQLKCYRVEPAGQGARDAALRQLIEKLNREGLFDAGRKKPLPRLPMRIAIVTSSAAAGFADVLKVLGAFPFLKLYHYAVPVQGEGAGARVAEALSHISTRHDDVGGLDVVMLVRGGGSAEDLAAFNEEPVVRALAAMSIPVITGIGHQTDRCIADMVADYEAHTPTEAAQVLVRHWKIARDRIAQLGIVLRRDVRRIFEHRRRELAGIARHELFRRPMEIVHRQHRLVDESGFAIARAMRLLTRRTESRLRGFAEALARAHPKRKLDIDRRRLAELASRMRQGHQRLLAGRRSALASIARHLDALDPTRILKRGYSLTVLERTGSLLRVAGDARPGDVLLTRTGDGQVQSTVGQPQQAKLFE